MVFLNRSRELDSLRDLFQDDQSKLCLLYGRRRLGKTWLLSQILKERGGLYFTVPEQSRAGILHHLATEVQRQTGRPVRYRSFPEFLRDIPEHKSHLVIMDEVQRLFEADKSTPSHLQEIWDVQLKNSNITLILCGSVIGTLHRLKSAKSPLYGRFTWSHHLKPFSYGATRLFYPGTDEPERVIRFAIFGATPQYHDITRRHALDQAIRKSFLETGSPLREEPSTLFQIELRSPDRYLEILEGMGSGDRTLGDISGRYGAKSADYTMYVRRLRDELGLIRTADPIGGKKRKGRLEFTDPFFHFYYSFIYPELPRLELGGQSTVARSIQESLPTYTGKIFEQIGRETMIALNGQTHQGVDVDFREIGSWWDAEDEIDVVAVRKDVAYAGEAKYRKSAVPRGEVEKLLQRARHFQEITGKKRIVPILFTRSSLSPKARALADDEQVLVVTLSDIGAIHDQAERSNPDR